MKLQDFYKENFKSLNENDQYIWDYVMKHKKECEKLSIDDLASKCLVSRTTILRFTRRLGLKGYSEFKVYLKLENSNQPQKTSDELKNIQLNHKYFMDEIAKKNFLPICKAIDEAHHIYFICTGSLQSELAALARYYFLMIHKVVYVIESLTESDTYIKAMRSDDLVLIISFSGEKERTLEVCRKLNVMHIPVISLTTNNNNPLSHMCDDNLYIDIPHIESDNYNIDGYSNYGLLLETICVRYKQYKEGELL